LGSGFFQKKKWKICLKFPEIENLDEKRKKKKSFNSSNLLQSIYWAATVGKTNPLMVNPYSTKSFAY
jgi:hypothetical protein